MIKANELRIGNKVKVPEHSLMNGTVAGIGERGIVLFKELITYSHTDLIDPIPLTPEILEAAGFKKGKYSWNMGLVDGYLSHDLVPTGKLLINDDYDEYCFDFPCQYLHQLQNLYFALTGTELEINIHANKQTT